MDRVLSARVDEAVYQRIGLLARELGTSKKAVIERAIRELAERVAGTSNADVLSVTHGAWAREEAVEDTVAAARAAFRDSMTRHHHAPSPE